MTQGAGAMSFRSLMLLKHVYLSARIFVYVRQELRYCLFVHGGMW